MTQEKRKRQEQRAKQQLEKDRKSEVVQVVSVPTYIHLVWLEPDIKAGPLP